MSKKLKTNQESVHNDLVRRVFYGRRQGHKLHPKQARLVEDFLPEIRITDFAEEPMRAFEVKKFAPENLVMEIGFGGGEHLARSRHHPCPTIRRCVSEAPTMYKPSSE